MSAADHEDWSGPGASRSARSRFTWSALLWALVYPRRGHRILPTIPGVVPGQHDRPAGCLFSSRCQYAVARCRAARPVLAGSPLAASRCFFPLDDAGHPTNDWVREATVAPASQ